MLSSNISTRLTLALSEAEYKEISEKFGVDARFGFRQASPGVFLFYPSEDGTRYSVYKSKGYVASLTVGGDRPKYLKTKLWGMSPVLTSKITKEGVLFEPDVSRTLRQSSKDDKPKKAVPLQETGNQLRDFITAVSTVNKFVAENGDIVVLAIDANGKLSFLVEGH